MLTTNGFDHRPSSFVIFDAKIFAQKLKEAKESENPKSYPVLNAYLNAARQFVAGTGTIPSTQLSEVYDDSNKTPQGIVEQDLRAYITYEDVSEFDIKDAASASVATQALMADHRLHFLDAPVVKDKKEIKSRDNALAGGISGHSRPATPDGKPIPIKRARKNAAKKPVDKVELNDLVQSRPIKPVVDKKSKSVTTEKKTRTTAGVVISDQILLQQEIKNAESAAPGTLSSLGIYKNHKGDYAIGVLVEKSKLTDIHYEQHMEMRGLASGEPIGFLAYDVIIGKKVTD